MLQRLPTKAELKKETQAVSIWEWSRSFEATSGRPPTEAEKILVERTALERQPSAREKYQAVQRARSRRLSVDEAVAEYLICGDRVSEKAKMRARWDLSRARQYGLERAQRAEKRRNSTGDRMPVDEARRLAAKFYHERFAEASEPARSPAPAALGADISPEGRAPADEAAEGSCLPCGGGPAQDDEGQKRDLLLPASFPENGLTFVERDAARAVTAPAF